MSGPRELRVLLSAYQCGPGMGSVSQIGWEWYRRLAARTPTTLFTHVRNRASLLASGAPLPGSEVVYIDTEWLAGPLHRFARRSFPSSEHPVFLLSSLDYFPYDALVVREARRRMRHGAVWDVAHRVTPVSPLAPTRLHRLGAPVVLGPLNGGLSAPAAFADLAREEAGWIHPLRGFARAIDLAWGSTRSASAILVATRATRAAVPLRHRHRCVPIGENGVDLEVFREAPWPEAPSEKMPLRILFVGRLTPVKGLPMLLGALARVRDHAPASRPPMELRVVGEGPARSEWEALAAGLELGDAVRFEGARSLPDVAEAMRSAHVLCLPSVRESGGAVILEAMASARPAIVLAHGGPAEIVDDEVGSALPADGAAAVTERLAEVLLDVCRDPEAWRRRGEAGRRRVAERYSWDAKIEEVLALYRKLQPGAEGMRAARPRQQPPSTRPASGAPTAAGAARPVGSRA